MKKLTTKWKLFHVTNYVLLVLNFISLIAFFFSIFNGTDTPVVIYSLGIIFVLIFISSIINIYIINRFFPDQILPIKTAKTLNIVRIVMILVTVFLFAACAVGVYVSFDRENGPGLGDTLGITYFILFFLLCLFTNILQFQIPEYLKKENAGKISSLIESIGN